eukprot:TRINITY_DN7049_c0_g1_i2.p1 TRINITY_DN7049_c0_g1~~TRINITY_DN7049_c0_g1_i2.p1  ORF type:complete len:314 (+),score=32.79 TRINITY_DN7049_c0_g1_i2:125-1066(+)
MTLDSASPALVEDIGAHLLTLANMTSLESLDIMPPFDNGFKLVGFFLVSFVVWMILRMLLSNMLFLSFARWMGLSPSYQVKFSESMWFFLYYLSNFTFGLYLGYTEPHFYESKYFWIGYPSKHTMRPAFQFYYISQLAFYTSALIYLFPCLIPWIPNARLKHKDRTIMLVHHVVTILLVVFSYSLSYVRVGSFVFILHDFSDIFLESAKTLHYIDMDGLAHVDFVLFATSFFICRLILFPYRTIWSIITEGPYLVDEPIWIHYYTSLPLLGALQVMNVMWFLLILRMIFQGMKKGKMDKDIRSDSDEDKSKDD